ncbi:MAG: hypothetical protein PHU63_00745 [Candidatus ainarchaeum sp.]|nr:hypothetical protein [Candidatus ainarchaeum sp.]
MSLLREERKGRARVVNEEIKNLILELYWNRNIGLRKIANYTGISTMTVWREIHREKIPQHIAERIYSLR